MRKKPCSVFAFFTDKARAAATARPAQTKAMGRPRRGFKFRPRSIRTSLATVFALFLLLIGVIGAFSIAELRAVNLGSAAIRDRWLQSTRILGDLNNSTSDMRAAEASRLLAHTPAQVASVEAEIRELDHQVAAAQTSYLRVPHDTEETALYRRFADDWFAYRRQSEAVMAAARRGASSSGSELYMTGSSKTYNSASDALGVLTARTVVRAAEASGQAENTYRLARSLILGAIIAATAGWVLAVNFVTRAFSRPLLELAERMRALAQNETRKDIGGADREDEIGEMSRAVQVFRANAIELAVSQQGLIQQASMLEERLEAEQRLTTQQRNFVSMASHEFRTPLTIIDGHAQRLLSMRQRITAKEIADRAQRTRRAVVRMRNVVDQLLTSNRLMDADPALYYHPEPFDPGAMLREICQLHREISPEADIVEHIEDAPPIAIGDPRLLHQMTSNLLSNAVKYSPGGGRIDASLTKEDDELVLTILDRGIGVPADELTAIFDRYHRGANTGGMVGMGIGLFLVKMVADLHGGRVEAESELEEGSKFTVRVPDPASVSRPRSA